MAGVPMPSRRRDSVTFTVLVVVLVCLGALPMLLILALSSAPGISLLATVMAALPVVPIVLCYLWLDRYEPEPRRLLLLGLLWGAFAATFAALVIEGVGGLLPSVSDTVGLAVVAPLAEEATKGAFLFLLLWLRRAELDGVLDGIVYAGMVGVGFAFTENILYLGAAYNGTGSDAPGGISGVTALFVVRCIFSPFAHPLFTSFTGIGVGIAVTTTRPALRYLAPVLGYLCAALAHGIWNGSTVYGSGSFVGTYVLVMVPAFAGMVWLAIWSRSSERKMLAAALADAAGRGLFPATDIGWVVDLRARRQARAYARQQGGTVGLDAMRTYQQAAIELGFLHHRWLRGTAPRDYAARGQDFLAQINAIRPTIAFPGQVVPTRASLT